MSNCPHCHMSISNPGVFYVDRVEVCQRCYLEYCQDPKMPRLGCLVILAAAAIVSAASVFVWTVG